MFDSSSAVGKAHQQCIYLESTHSFLDNEASKDSAFRKRLHLLLSQNFELKQLVNRQHGDLKTSQQERRELKEHLKIVLDEMAANDKIIQTLKNGEQEHQVVIKHLQEEIAAIKQGAATEREMICNLLQHNQNLQAQNQLIIEIKQKYALDLAKLRIDFDTSKIQNERMAKENEFLSLEINRLLEQLNNLEAELQTGRNDIEQYQKFVMQKLAAAKNSEEFHQSCHQQLQNLHCKYSKYKLKASGYKRQRDELLLHLSQFSREMDGETFRKYYVQSE